MYMLAAFHSLHRLILSVHSPRFLLQLYFPITSTPSSPPLRRLTLPPWSDNAASDCHVGPQHRYFRTQSITSTTNSISTVAHNPSLQLPTLSCSS
ncbi:hypothetical protein M758_6G052100 [Ceratodon purpureus]|uniref:Uncharacterized protein n=1 Tax=Ceratodon purpureus TaxID=3225 RepID=A0A8T0HE67_CERPU|nr:hypothetical protein KC19_6G055000 [Ceratodon purpureus]KAG0612786.1 hypothetical protein M758_6G052100 [Ceratodon purpureus]